MMETSGYENDSVDLSAIRQFHQWLDECIRSCLNIVRVVTRHPEYTAGFVAQLCDFRGWRPPTEYHPGDEVSWHRCREDGPQKSIYIAGEWILSDAESLSLFRNVFYLIVLTGEDVTLPDHLIGQVPTLRCPSGLGAVPSSPGDVTDDVVETVQPDPQEPIDPTDALLVAMANECVRRVLEIWPKPFMRIDASEMAAEMRSLWDVIGGPDDDVETVISPIMRLALVRCVSQPGGIDEVNWRECLVQAAKVLGHRNADMAGDW